MDTKQEEMLLPVAQDTHEDETNGYAADADAAADPVVKTPEPESKLNAGEEQPAVPALPLAMQTPIFIGCENPDVITTLKEAFNDTFELCVMSEEMLFKSKQLWFLGKMDEKEREKMQKLKFTEEKRMQALELAGELGASYGHGMAEGKPFKHYDLKNYFTRDRSKMTNGKQKNVNFSNRDIRNLIDTFCIFGFLTSPDTTLNFEKRNWYVTLADTDRIVVMNAAKQKLEHEKAALELLLLDTEKEMGEIFQRIESASKQLDEADAVTPDAPKAKSKRKAKENDKGETAKADTTSKRKRSTKSKGDSE